MANSNDKSSNQAGNKQAGNNPAGNKQSGTQGGTHEQHVEAGRQSHKNDGGKQGG